MSVPTAAAEAVLVGLDPEQRAAAEAAPGPVCILAGAGTGKTRTITHRIAYAVLTGGVVPGHVLAVTFTARAAGELRDRLRALGIGPSEARGVQARTFHAAALRQLGYFWPRVAGGALPQLAESKIRLVAQAAGRLRLSLPPGELRDVAAEIEWAKASLVPAEGYQVAAASAGRTPPRDPEQMARLFASYEQVKDRAGVLDFDDLLLLTSAAILEHEDVAAEVRSRYRHFVVDEYQDVTPLQQQLLDAWLGDRDDLCVVGDANQTIYSFTGASAANLLGFTRRFHHATVIRLKRDYRSTPQVVALANRVIAAATGVPAGARLSLIAQLPAGPEPAYVECNSEPEEAREVTRRVRALITAGLPAAAIAVLFRVNAQSEVFEQALAAAGVSYVLRGGARFFERAEVREAVLLLRGSARAADPDRPAGLAAGVIDVLDALGWRSDSPPAGAGATRERWDNLAALARLAEQVAVASPDAGLGEFVAHLEDRAAAQHAPSIDGVTLASLHAAKGLEWDAVFLVGLVDGTLPITHAETPAQVDEERRLLYVGITRARRHLTLSWALARAEGGRRSRHRSRFLAGLAPERGAPGAAAKAAGGATGGTRSRDTVRCAACGRVLDDPAARAAGHCGGCPDGAEAALFTRLRAWRSERAKEQGVPAYVVFSDATLAAIAAGRPTTAPALGRLSGVGSVKIERYGADVLRLCGDSGENPAPAGG